MRLTFLLAALSPLLTGATDEQIMTPIEGRARANSWIRVMVPAEMQDPTVAIDVRDTGGQVYWRGTAHGAFLDLFTRDWPDGTYLLKLGTAEPRKIIVDTEYLEAVRARAGLMLRHVNAHRDANGAAPAEWRGAANLLQRIMTLHLWREPRRKIADDLRFCEQRLGIRTATATARLLGSGAADHEGYEGPPFPGRRERSMLFVPPDVVFDFAAHAERKLARWGYAPRDVRHVFLTHEHADHFDAAALVRFALKRRALRLDRLIVHGSPLVCRQLRDQLDKTAAGGDIIIIEMQPGSIAAAGEVRVEALRAVHPTSKDPLCYRIEVRGAMLFYGTDSAYPSAETLRAISQRRLDVFAYELTAASADDGREHMDIGDYLLLVDRLRTSGALDTWSRVIPLHQSREGPGMLPDIGVFERMAGFEAGYDGMPIPFAYLVEEPASRPGSN